MREMGLGKKVRVDFYIFSLFFKFRYHSDQC